MSLNKFTIKQLIIAASLARGLSRTQICQIANCVDSYITKLLKQEDFNNLIMTFKGLPIDNDTKQYRGLGTIFMEIGRLLYSQGEKQINNG